MLSCLFSPNMWLSTLTRRDSGYLFVFDLLIWLSETEPLSPVDAFVYSLRKAQS